MPRFGLLSALIVFLAVVLRINLASLLLGWGLFKVVAFPLDPVLHGLGCLMLVRLTGLEPLWTWLYNAPLAPFFRLNNTVVLGGLFTGLVLLAPNVMVFSWLVRRYRASWQLRVAKWRISQALAGSKLVQTALKLKSLGGQP